MVAERDDIASADIMTVLTAILSHPKDFGETGIPVSTVILLDHFEEYTLHPRQTLLYNLFDIAQSKKAPICVLGLTTRIDATEALEKRVRSRFSQRIIHFNSLDHDQFRTLALSPLHCDLQLQESMMDNIPNREKERLNQYTDTWNQYVEESAELRKFIRYIYLVSGDMCDLLRSLIPRVAVLGSISEEEETPRAFPEFMSLIPGTDDLSTQGKVCLLKRLSVLSLGLLIAAARVELKSGVINFSTTFNEFNSLTTRALISQKGVGVTNSRAYSAQVSIGTWEALLREAILVPLTGIAGKGWEFRAVTVEVGLHEIRTAVKASAITIPSVMNSWLTLG